MQLWSRYTPSAEAKEERPQRRLLASVGLVVGSAGFSAGLAATYMGMRRVMETSGGACASGGPYVISSPCPHGAAGLLTLGIIGMLVFGGIYAAFLSWIDGPVLGTGLVMWAALFGALGWNFIDLGKNPPRGMSGAGGWVFTGVIFWVMALGGLIPAIWMAVNWLRAGGEPDPMLTVPEPLVRANAHAVAPTAPAAGAQVPTRLVIPKREWDDPLA